MFSLQLLTMNIYIYICAGEKISPIEVDAVLLSNPDIAEGVAFGVPDDKYGEEVKSNKVSFHSHSHTLIILFQFVIPFPVSCLLEIIVECPAQ